MTLLEIYQTEEASGRIDYDPAQVEALRQLEILSSALEAAASARFRWFKRRKFIKGLYLWGRVGAGKTYLMDCFFQSLHRTRKMRLHFHHFMKQVHNSLTRLQGRPDPLRIIARHFSAKARVFCFDEFIVNDIADAMLLGRLLPFLFEKGVVLVTTSNLPPDALYANGLQRELFLPAIEQIKAHCEALEVRSKKDYRLRSLKEGGVYFYPLNPAAEEQMIHCFDLYAHGAGEENVPLIIEQRPIMTRWLAPRAVWFDFHVICSPPRSHLDYLAIAKRFPVVMISHLPIIAPDDEISVTYWIELVDIFYDNRTVLILSAAAPLDKIYPEGKKRFEFERTLSRLKEMQSLEYVLKKLNKNHYQLD